ncbi:hypothetical protein SODALDRAFT_24443 [Sodiomyces alkalinus F11]|uniref:Uncharacterized protein n=1 Tax=Sodiomyces alkalinus (strain CBS 110278 / VKM F-3762 / F11) TaxID=1314773 RepID=A0A3N2Q853_SODAK|nr:hypothetical protein SODALDRAFT_24443 [Sodiomyces alkalinus F11]ROT42815.1 hypothetical protein SODALDRAFT_24443 [Sodiomyces alkalinus F11]
MHPLKYSLALRLVGRTIWDQPGLGQRDVETREKQFHLLRKLIMTNVRIEAYMSEKPKGENPKRLQSGKGQTRPKSHQEQERREREREKEKSGVKRRPLNSWISIWLLIIPCVVRLGPFHIKPTYSSRDCRQSPWETKCFSR